MDRAAKWRIPLPFKIGDMVVYPNHGLGVIEKIEQRDLGDRTEEFLRLRIIGNDSTVMVPRSNTGNVGLRPVMTRKEVDLVFDVLKDNKIRVFDDWKGRFQENSDKMRTGSITEVALVFKSLTHLSLQKNLSYRERRMLDRARYLIVSEIA
jgi:CarD family transcriptional regulator